MQSLADLLDLQDIDLQIDRLLHDRQALPALDQYKAAHQLVQRLTRDRDAAAEALRNANLAFDKTNGELDLAEAKLAAEQNRLYAGGLSARDATFLRQEVEMLGRKKGEMEDEVLELLEQREGHEQAIAALEEELVEATATKDRLEAEIGAEWKAIDAQLARKEARKADIVPLIPGPLLGLYEELRESKEGVAVGRLAEGTCGGCHLRLTAAEQIEAKRSDPPRCLHCLRILVP